MAVTNVHITRTFSMRIIIIVGAATPIECSSAMDVVVVVVIVVIVADSSCCSSGGGGCGSG